MRSHRTPISQNILILSFIICILAYFPGIYLMIFGKSLEKSEITIKSSSQMNTFGSEGLLPTQDKACD